MMNQFIVVNFQGKPWLTLINETQYAKPELIGLSTLIKRLPKE